MGRPLCGPDPAANAGEVQLLLDSGADAGFGCSTDTADATEARLLPVTGRPANGFLRAVCERVECVECTEAIEARLVPPVAGRSANGVLRTVCECVECTEATELRRPPNGAPLSGTQRRPGAWRKRVPPSANWSPQKYETRLAHESLKRKPGNCCRVFMLSQP